MDYLTEYGAVIRCKQRRGREMWWFEGCAILLFLAGVAAFAFHALGSGPVIVHGARLAPGAAADEFFWRIASRVLLVLSLFSALIAAYIAIHRALS